MEASAGGVLVSADGNVASAIKLHATAGANQTMDLVNTGGTGAAAIALTAAAGGVDINAAGALDLNSSAGAISIGNDDIDQAINIGTQGARTISIGTGAFADTINVGNATGATAVAITSGTGGVTMTTGTGAVNVSADAAVTTLNVGTGAAAKTCTFGSTNTSSTTTLQSGTGGVALNGDVTIAANKDLNMSGSGTITTGTGRISVNGQLVKTITPPAQITTDGVATYTMANMLTQLIFRHPSGGGRADKFDTAANIVLGMPGTAVVGDTIEVVIVNDADAAETITISDNTGLTLKGKLTIAQNEARRFLIRLTNVIDSSEAVTIIGLA